MQAVAVSWHVFSLLRNSESTFEFFGRTFAIDSQALGLGGLGLARFIPIIFVAMIAGILADTRDRRKILIFIQIVATVATAILTFLTFTDRITIPLLYFFTALTSALFALELPSSRSLIPNLVPREALANAVSLNTILQYVGTIVGPGIAAWLIAQTSIGSVYLFNAISFGSMIFALFFLNFRDNKVKETTFSWAALKEGIRYTYNNKLVWSTMIIDFWATFFASARSMLPIVAERILGMGVEGYGLLATAQPVGAVLMGVILSYQTQIRKQGKMLLISVAIYGLATALFGLSEVFVSIFTLDPVVLGYSIPLIIAYTTFALTGAADTVSSVIRGTIREMTTPDELRGRMTSVNMMFFMGGPQLGELEAGVAAAMFGAPFAIITGGIATILMTGYMAYKYPKLRAYDQ